MAFDIYVGPVSRYLVGDWMNVAQAMAEQQGIKYTTISPAQPFLRRLFAPKPDKVYKEWTQAVRSAFAQGGFGEPAWDDAASQDYVTDRPGWEGFVAFVAQYAYARHPEMDAPKMALSMPELAEAPAFEIEVADEFSPVVAMMSSRFFLPGEFSHVVPVSYCGESDVVAPLDLLDRAVNTVCEHCGFDRAQIAKAAMDQPGEVETFAHTVLYGASIFARLVDEALKRNLPLVLDY